MPVVQERDCLWDEFGSLSIVPQDPIGRKYCEKRRKFIDLLVSTDFCKTKEETKLEIAMKSGGVDEVLDELYRQLADKDKEIWYGPGLSLPEKTTFAISPDLNMSQINSPYLRNLVNLKNIKQTRFEGINSPTIYIGTEGSTFGLHIEDFALESINRSLGAAEKLWFTVPPAYYGSFCSWLSKCGVPPEVSNCSSFMQHKQNFIDPRAAVKAGFPVRTVRQRVGDVVYLLPFAIHWGVNLGFTLNEAVNSCSKTWLRSGLVSKPMCQCASLEKSMQHVQLDKVFVSTGATQEMLQKWKHGQHLGVMATLDLRNPYSAQPGACPTDMSLLLGTSDKDYDLDCKEVTSIMSAFAGHERGHYIGGIVCLDDGDELEIDDICVAADEDQDQQQPATSKLDYQCPFPCRCPCLCSCPCWYQAKSQGEAGFTALKNHAKNEHAEHPRYKSIVEDSIVKKYSKEHRNFKSKQYSTCHCGKKLMEKGDTQANLKRHQDSTNCKKRKKN